MVVGVVVELVEAEGELDAVLLRLTGGVVHPPQPADGAPVLRHHLRQADGVAEERHRPLEDGAQGLRRLDGEEEQMAPLVAVAVVVEAAEADGVHHRLVQMEVIQVGSELLATQIATRR